ncbi:unnamed protein product, partial [marine sediment metagenome]
GIELPEFTQETEIEKWVEDTKSIIEGKSQWEITYEMCIGIFSFKKLQLYLDIDKHRKKVLENPVLQVLTGAPQKLIGDIKEIPEEEKLDEKVKPKDTFQVLDADSSQGVAIEAAKKGVSFVVQGPPGTGKSQTIVNVIAEFLAQRKRVLFVSQKMAALEVVKKRLDEVGLGHYCLELHSHKANKKRVLHQLGNQLNKRYKVKEELFDEILHQLGIKIEELNKFGQELLEPRGIVKKSLYEIVGELSNLEKVPDVECELNDPLKITKDKIVQWETELGTIQQYKKEIINYNNHPWRHTAISSLTLSLREKLKKILEKITLSPSQLQQLITDTKKEFELHPGSINALDRTHQLFHKIVKEKPNDLNLEKDWFLKNLESELKKIKIIAQNLDKEQELKDYLGKRYRKEFFEIDNTKALLDKFKEDFSSFLRFLKPEYWKTRAHILKFARKEGETIDIKRDLERLLLLQKIQDQTPKLQKEIKHLFSENNLPRRDNWEETRELINWAQELRVLMKGKISQIFVSKIIEDDPAFEDFLKKYDRIYQQEFKPQLQEILEYFEKEYTQWKEPVEKVGIKNILEWLSSLNDSFQNLQSWIEFNNHINSLQEFLQQYTTSFLKKNHPPDYLIKGFQKQFLKALLGEVEKKITYRSGSYYNYLIKKFQNLDEKQKVIAKKQIIKMLEKRKPKPEVFSTTY